MITEVPFAAPGLGVYMVREGVTTLRAIREGGAPVTCSRHVQLSDPGAAPGQMANAPAASGVSGSGDCANRLVAAARTSRSLIGVMLLPNPKRAAIPPALSRCKFPASEFTL